MKTNPFYKEGVSAPFVIEIKENGKPVSGLTVHATFDHGTVTTTLKEKSNGIYEGKVHYQWKENGKRLYK